MIKEENHEEKMYYPDEVKASKVRSEKEAIKKEPPNIFK